MKNQLNSVFTLPCGLPESYNTQHVLIRLLEEWREILTIITQWGGWGGGINGSLESFRLHPSWLANSKTLCIWT